MESQEEMKMKTIEIEVSRDEYYAELAKYSVRFVSNGIEYSGASWTGAVAIGYRVESNDGPAFRLFK